MHAESLVERHHVADLQVDGPLGSVEFVGRGRDTAIGSEKQRVWDRRLHRGVTAGRATMKANPRGHIAPHACADAEVEQGSGIGALVNGLRAGLVVQRERGGVVQGARRRTESDVEIEIAAVGPWLPGLSGRVVRAGDNDGQDDDGKSFSVHCESPHKRPIVAWAFGRV